MQRYKSYSKYSTDDLAYAEHIGTKTAVQIRSHAQKFFSKLQREQSMNGKDGEPMDFNFAKSCLSSPLTALKTKDFA